MEFFGAELLRQRLKLRIAVGRSEELQEGHLKVIGKADKSIDRNAVGAGFIFLYLLESHVDALAGFFLRLAGGDAGDADAMPQFAVETIFGQLSGFSGRGENLGGFT